MSSGHDDADLRSRAARLSTEQKVRLLTGADFWALHPEPDAGLRRVVVSDGPAGSAARPGTSATPRRTCPSPDRAGRHLGRDRGRARRPAAGRRGPAQGRGRAARAHGQPAPHPARRPPLRVLLRGPAAHRQDRRRLRRAACRAAGVGATVKHFVANDSETERMTFDVRVDERTLRELYLAPFEASSREAGAVGGDGRLQRGQRRHDDREPAAAATSCTTSGASTAWSCPTGSPTRSTVAAATAALDLAMPGPTGPWGDALVAAVRAGRGRRGRRSTTRCCGILRLAARVGAPRRCA